MPTVLRQGPYRLFFYSNEGHEPPHVHVSRENRLAKFWLGTVSVAENFGFEPFELRRIARIVSDHQLQLLEAWREFFSD